MTQSNSLNDEVILLLTELNCLEDEVRSISDYGEATGIREEDSAIRNELKSIVSFMIARALKLRMRAKQYKRDQIGDRQGRQS